MMRKQMSRDYLKSVDLESILQQLVRDALEAKPDDALAFAADWTRKKMSQRPGGSPSPDNSNNNSGGLGAAAGSPTSPLATTTSNKKRSSPLSAQDSTGTDDSKKRDCATPPMSGRSDSGKLMGALARGSQDEVLKNQVSVNIKAKSADADLDANDPVSVVRYSWRMRTEDEDDNFLLHFSDLVLNVLFTQHPSLRALLDAIGVSTETAADALSGVWSQIILGDASPSKVARTVMQKFNAFAPLDSPKRAVLLRVRQRHFHYLLCSTLYAAECVFTPNTWRQIGSDWLQVFGDNLEEIQSAVFDEQIVIASLSADKKSALDSDFEKSVLLTTCSLARHSAIDTVKGIWLEMTAAQQERICRKFFAVLFTQHRTLIRLFVDEDKETAEGESLVDQAPVKELQVILTQVLRGFLSVEGIAALAERHAVDGGVPQRYLHYALSGLLTALSLELGPKRWDSQVSEAWRVFITRVLDSVGLGFDAAETKRKQARGEVVDEAEHQQSGCSRTAAEKNDASQSVDSGLKMRQDDPPKLEATNAGSAFSVAAECWTYLSESRTGAEISETFFNILFTQHPAMAKTVVRTNSELSEIMGVLPDLFSGVCNCEIAESDLREMGARLTGRGIDEQKADRACAAAMSVFAILLGITVFREREDALQTVCRYITDNILFGVQNSAAVLAARAPEIIVFESWSGIIDKEGVIRKAIEVMRIQHRSLTRDLLDGLDMDELAKAMVEFVTKSLAPQSSSSSSSTVSELNVLANTGTNLNNSNNSVIRLSDEEAQAFVDKLKAKCEEKQRPVDKKFATYFAFSFQSAVGIILGSSRFESVAHHWQSEMEKVTKRFADMM